MSSPADRELADAYLQQADEAVADARVLAAGRRHAAVVAHAQMAVELALKAAILRAAGGSALAPTHYVARIARTEARVAWRRLPGVIRESVMWLEDTYPSHRPVRNTRYPFRAPTGSHPGEWRIRLPADAYGSDDAARALRCAEVVRRAVKDVAPHGLKRR